jgi:FecR-like protein
MTPNNFRCTSSISASLNFAPVRALPCRRVNGVTVKPYVVATGATLADAAYMGGIGGGLTLHATVANISLDPYGEVVRQTFRNSAFYPLASGLSGTLSTVGLQASGPIAAGLGWQSRIAYARASDQFAFDSYKSFAADVWLPWLVSWPGLRPWTIVPTAGGHDLALRRARSVRGAVYDGKYHRMAGRPRRRSAGLGQAHPWHAGAISKRKFKRGGVLVSRPVDQRRTDDQILNEASMTGKIQSVAIHSVISALAVAAVVAIAGVVPSLAQQIGTATAVNPSTEATPPGGSTTTLTVGARVLHKEHIHTSPTGSVQLLFLDKSTLNIAPNTNLVIDEFVYDPASNSGHMLTKLTQGTLQYIGGQLSHQGAVTITTPAATIGIRGATGTFSYGPSGAQVITQYGQFTITNGAGTIVSRARALW